MIKVDILAYLWDRDVVIFGFYLQRFTQLKYVTPGSRTIVSVRYRLMRNGPKGVMSSRKLFMRQ